MKNLLKYILICILALVFYDRGKEDMPSKQHEYFSELQEEQLTEEEVLQSSSKADICLPRQSSLQNATRVQNTGRHDSTNRFSSELVKFGRTISSSTNYIVQSKSRIQYSSFMDPGQKLVTLCRLII